MIYLKQIFNGRTTPALMACLALLMIIIQVGSTKIAYKKPIQGKTNAIKEKHFKAKLSEESKTTTKPVTMTPLAPPATSTSVKSTTPAAKATTTTTAATTIHEELEFAETTHAVKTELSIEEKPVKVVEEVQQLEGQNQSETMTNSSMEFHEIVVPNENFEGNQLEQQPSTEKTKSVPSDMNESQERTVVETPLNFEEDSTISAVAATCMENQTEAIILTTSTAETTASTIATTSTVATTASNRPVACTCGVFMTSQIKRTGNPYEPPIGRPVIINELDRTYPCNAIGQKQCQTKCLETIVQHLPNSANILCASLDHDIRKERAYLFIKNCRNQWFNTNLAAGREYCCKNGQPYQCPLV